MNEEQLQQEYDVYSADALKRGGDPLPFFAWSILKDEPYFQRSIEQARAVDELKTALNAMLVPPLTRIADGLTRIVDWMVARGAKRL